MKEKQETILLVFCIFVLFFSSLYLYVTEKTYKDTIYIEYCSGKIDTVVHIRGQYTAYAIRERGYPTPNLYCGNGITNNVLIASYVCKYSIIKTDTLILK